VQMDVVLRTTDGRSVVLGAEDEIATLFAEIMSVEGGSSLGGRWSTLFGITGNETVSPEVAARLAHEAAELQAVCRERLSDQANLLLDRLASI
jgi:hypothetical protein